MKYGYFDEAGREYVITRPDTPEPWANYLGSPEYGAIISNQAGGYSFVRSGANGRLLRYRFNSVPADQAGRYIYVRDRESGDYWSGSWQPVGKPLDLYRSECRHGLSYTVISSSYSGISTETLYLVPLGKTYEVWRLKIRNEGDRKRTVSVFGCAEFTNDSNYEQDAVNLQYTQFVTRTCFHRNRVLQLHNEFCRRNADGSNGEERFFGLSGAPVSSWCGDREEFIGPYRSYENPIAVERGDCGNVPNYGGNSAGVLQADLDLEPGEERQLCFVLGVHPDAEAEKILSEYEDPHCIETQWEELKDFWEEKLCRFSVHTPDENFNHMVNTWNAYQCFITFIWSRAASFTYCGLRNGLGFRDTVQDIQGILHLVPEMALERIRFMFSGQTFFGAGLPLIGFHHEPGHVKLPGEPGYDYDPYRADDALWLFPTVAQYIGESGNIRFLDEVIPFADHGEADVYEHLRRAVRFSLEHSGAHGLPVGLYADWNDCLRMGEQGESVFVAFQLYQAMQILLDFARIRNDLDTVSELEEQSRKLRKTLNDVCWQGDRYLRGIRESGEMVGSRDDPEANLWLNPQSWSVISGCADEERAQNALETVHLRLNTEYGAVIMDPPYREHAFDGARMQLFLPSIKENGSVFSQAQGWLILAESLMGHGNRAYEYYRECSPAEQNDRAEIRRLEPYVHGQFVEGPQSPHKGRAHVHWLTGTASTVMVACVRGILGIRPTAEGVLIQPSVPSDWKEFTIDKFYRGKRLHITVKNPNGAQGGPVRIALNGETLPDSLVPFGQLENENELVVTMPGVEPTK
ncbi:GH36-type glycosyl hydrolase domain-containing protein [Caproicibacter sp.]|uniref:GH36-type glycosyl hydrolase domain-containing protein n=1 Tax=Caproicibacter sp. TaxID=2814884 RepID=UPI003988A83E